jgi:hypothetical protein
MASKGTNAMHVVTPADITICHGKAIVEAAASIMIRFTVEGLEYELVSYCRLIYRMEKVDVCVWKIRGLTVVYTRDMIVPVEPHTSRFRPDLLGYRESYKYLTWVLKHRGFAISQDLPGTDLPDTVSRAMREHNEWCLS